MFSLVDTTVKGGNVGRKLLQEQKQKTLQKRENLVHARLNKNDPSRTKKIIQPPEDKYIPAIFKIRIKPTIKQKRIINDWIAAYRKTWNLCLREIKNGEKKNEVILRNRYIIQKNMSEGIYSDMSGYLERERG
jgi:hypothetical protein